MGINPPESLSRGAYLFFLVPKLLLGNAPFAAPARPPVLMVGCEVVAGFTPAFWF
jgi:hypothetical protein